MNRAGKVWLYWLPPIVWAAGIFTLSCLTFPPRAPRLPLEDKIVHGLLFSVLAFLLYRAFRRERRFAVRRAAVLAFLVTAAYGIADELHQHFTPQRTVDFRDWVADALGAALVFVMLTRRGRRDASRNAGPVR